MALFPAFRVLLLPMVASSLRKLLAEEGGEQVEEDEDEGEGEGQGPTAEQTAVMEKAWTVSYTHLTLPTTAIV